MADWRKIKAEYIRGGISYRQLAEKYGVSFSSVKRKALQEKWTDLRRRSEQKATTKIIESAANQEAKRVDKTLVIADMLLDMIAAGIKDGSINPLTKSSMRDITGALKDIREIKGVKSDLDLKEQMARIEKLRREAQQDTESKDIKVIISGDLEEYSK